MSLPLRPVSRAFFSRPVLTVAHDLLGCLLVHEPSQGRTVGMIVEAEAYGEDDPGSHASRGRTERNAPMFEQPGHAYVYVSYGIHHCLNAVTDRTGTPGAVLIRAAEPVAGLDVMRARRGPVPDRDLARGPGRLTQAFGIDRALNRADLTVPPLTICMGERLPAESVLQTERIGLGGADDRRPWRFAVRGSRWVSRTPPLPGTATGSRRS